MNKKVSLGVTISLIAVAVAITAILTMTFSQNLFNSLLSTGSQTRTELSEIESYVQANYYKSVDDVNAQPYLSAAYIESIGDKYAVYYTPEKYAAKKQVESGYTTGIGFEYTEDESGYIRITAIDESTAAAEADAVVGDIIVKINDTDVLAAGYETAATMLTGTEGESVKITIRREGVDNEQQFIKKKTEVKSVSFRMLSGYIGYIKISAFNETTSGQVRDAVEKLIADGANQLIFDVRNCQDGILESAEESLNYIVEGGTWATATFKDGHQQIIAKTDDTYSQSVPMAVIVNENTSYAAELFAVVMRDSGKATLVGTTTAGVGVVKYTQQMSTGSAVTITVATYETVKTPCFDGTGIKPSFEVKLSKEEQEDFANLDETTDPQLKKAIEIVDTAI
ncbi:MAG: S41 family peptidase [Oscillospiraceae bacterium]